MFSFQPTFPGSRFFTPQLAACTSHTANQLAPPRGYCALIIPSLALVFPACWNASLPFDSGSFLVILQGRTNCFVCLGSLCWFCRLSPAPVLCLSSRQWETTFYFSHWVDHCVLTFLTTPSSMSALRAGTMCVYLRPLHTHYNVCNICYIILHYNNT